MKIWLTVTTVLVLSLSLVVCSCAGIQLPFGGSISGHVYQADGVTPVDKAEVIYIQTSGKPTCETSWELFPFRCGICVAPRPPCGRGTIKTSADGSYRFTGLNSGDYHLSASAQKTARAKKLFSHGTKVVFVNPCSESSGIDLTLFESGSISGYVYEKDGKTPIPEAGVTATLLTEYYHGAYVSEIYAKWDTDTGTDGRYSFSTLPPGEYTVLAGAKHHWGTYYKNIPAGIQWGCSSTDTQDNPPTRITVPSGQALTGIDFLLPSSVQTEAVSISLVPEAITVRQGEQFSVDVMIHTPYETRGAQLDLTYDPRLLTVKSIEEGDFYSNWTAVNGGGTGSALRGIDNTAAKISGWAVMISNKSNRCGQLGEGTLATINMEALADSYTGTSDVLLSEVIVVDVTVIRNNLKNIQLNQGKVTVIGKDQD